MSMMTLRTQSNNKELLLLNGYDEIGQTQSEKKDLTVKACWTFGMIKTAVLACYVSISDKMFI